MKKSKSKRPNPKHFTISIHNKNLSSCQMTLYQYILNYDPLKSTYFQRKQQYLSLRLNKARDKPSVLSHKLESLQKTEGEPMNIGKLFITNHITPIASLAIESKNQPWYSKIPYISLRRYTIIGNGDKVISLKDDVMYYPITNTIVSSIFISYENQERLVLDYRRAVEDNLIENHLEYQRSNLVKELIQMGFGLVIGYKTQTCRILTLKEFNTKDKYLFKSIKLMALINRHAEMVIIGPPDKEISPSRSRRFRRLIHRTILPCPLLLKVFDVSNSWRWP
jgi:hypothetical protein